jgi:hypothetical protein
MRLSSKIPINAILTEASLAKISTDIKNCCYQFDQSTGATSKERLVNKGTAALLI